VTEPRDVEDLARRLGVDFDDLELLERAVTHRSWAFEHRPGHHNERLEFLGDAVLGLVVTEELYARLPDAAEGELSPVRAATVRESALADIARGLGLGDFLRLGRGEAASGGADKDSLLSDALEAVIAAVHVTHGQERAAALVRDLVADRLDAVTLGGEVLDAKTRLQERAAAEGLPAPEYRVSAEGPDHDPDFTATVLLGDREEGHGRGRTKKQAEQRAAAAALGALDLR